MPKTTITDVVFDLDGTLIDSHRDLAEAVNDVLIALGRPARAIDDVKRMIGHGVAHLLGSALAEDDAEGLAERKAREASGDKRPGLAGPEPEVLARARELFKETYAARLVRYTRPFPGVVDAIAELARRGIRASVATNKPAFFTQPIVRALELDRAGLLAWACADEAGARKPDPAVLRLALAKSAGSGAGASVVYVGDMPVDHETARAFGCVSAGVSWGFDPEGLRRLGPDLWIERPSEIVRRIAG